MAREKLATLEVWIDREDDSSSSDSFYTRANPNHVRITLRPKGDKERGGSDEATVFCHELGHFVGNVLKVPAQLKAGWPSTTPEEQLEGERSAWHFAEMINPKAGPDCPAAKFALGCYEKTAKMYKGVPQGFLRDMGFIG